MRLVRTRPSYYTNSTDANPSTLTTSRIIVDIATSQDELINYDYGAIPDTSYDLVIDGTTVMTGLQTHVCYAQDN